MKENELRFRHVHLDFHTSEAIPEIGADFDPDVFAETLKKAHVDTINCFARGHHGWLYYNSKKFPERIHPNLVNRNLLKEQIKACHKRDIRIPIYITVQWDQYTAERHPEWLTMTADGKQEGTEPYKAGFYRSLCLNTPYVDLLKEMTEEVLTTLPTDGIWFDIVLPKDCSCSYCRRDMLGRGLDPSDRRTRIQFGLEVLEKFKLDMTRFVRKFNKDCHIFYNSGHISAIHRGSMPAYTHLELESLASGFWGYMHFPVTARYARTLGKEILGMTGKFQTVWGDFHSFKNVHGLKFECQRALALNAKCCIGDQLPPNGNICKYTYDLIGRAYADIEQKEPWCTKAEPVTEIAVMHPEEFHDFDPTKGIPHSLLGVTRMLQEGGHQFDIVDTKADYSDYKLLILPDEIPVDKMLQKKIKDYLKKGGTVIASFESGMNADKTEFVLDSLGVSFKSDGPTDEQGRLARGRWYPNNDYTDYIVPRGAIGKGLNPTEYVMYLRAMDIKTRSKTAKVLADRVAAYFDRTYAHFCSHLQTPSSGKKAGPAIVQNGKCIYFAHPIFSTYSINGPLWCKTMLFNAIDMLMGRPLLKHNGPSTIMATINAQKKKNRWVVHLLHYIPERRAEKLDIVEDCIGLYNVEISVNAPRTVKSVTCVPQKQDIDFKADGKSIIFTVPEIHGHQMVSINFKKS